MICISNRGVLRLIYSFDDFFTTPPDRAAQPEALGFGGFFKGAYAYHWHNRWCVSSTPLFLSPCVPNSCIDPTRWTPFDPTRNYPDLGARFVSHQKPRPVEAHTIPTDLS